MELIAREHLDVSFVLATHNRRDVLRQTLQRLSSTDATHRPSEIILVDNASSDGTVQEVRTAYPWVNVIPLRRNFGSCAKAFGVDRARGKYVVFLDDDSFPLPGVIERMIEHFEANTLLGAAGFRVVLPDGTEESAAFGDMFVGCGVGFRRSALVGAGGLDPGLFMQAEEYDLGFRLIARDWKVQRFPDLEVVHLKTTHARRPARTLYLDARNNLLLTYRYFPEPWDEAYRSDWVERYRWIAEAQGCGAVVDRAVRFAGRVGIRQREQYPAFRLTPEVVDEVFHVSEIRDQVAGMAERGIRKVVLARLGKNILPFVLALRECEVEIGAIADDRFASPGRQYRGIPVVSEEEIRDNDVDAVVISDTSPVHARAVHQGLAEQTDLPILRWFGDDLDRRAQFACSVAGTPSDSSIDS